MNKQKIDELYMLMKATGTRQVIYVERSLSLHFFSWLYCKLFKKKHKPKTYVVIKGEIYPI